MPEKRPCGECYWFHLEEDLEDYYDAGEGDCWRFFHTTYEDSLEDGKVHIGDNDLLKIHLLNSAIKMSTERGRGKLVKLSPNDHIDGTAALADACCVRQKWYAEIGDQLKNED